MAIFEFLKAVRRRWLLVLACFLLATVVGYVLSPKALEHPLFAGVTPDELLNLPVAAV